METTRAESIAARAAQLSQEDKGDFFLYLCVLSARDNPQTPERVRELDHELQAGIAAGTMTKERGSEMIREMAQLIPIPEAET